MRWRKSGWPDVRQGCTLAPVGTPIMRMYITMSTVGQISDRSIFITYNPTSDFEQTLAVRLYTIGQVNGFEMYLPDRFNGLHTSINQETRYRIAHSKWLVCFSTQKLSADVQREIDYAYQLKQDRSKILVIFDTSSHRWNQVEDSRFISFFFDPTTSAVDGVIAHVLGMIDNANVQERELGELQGKLRKTESERNAFAAFLGIGLGLLALNALTDDDSGKASKKSSTKKTTKKSSKKK
jgi:hypothetical protein